MDDTGFKRLTGSLVHVGLLTKKCGYSKYDSNKNKNGDKVKDQRPERRLDHNSPISRTRNMTTKMLSRSNTLASLVIYSLKDRRLLLSSLNVGKREMFSSLPCFEESVLHGGGHEPQSRVQKQYWKQEWHMKRPSCHIITNIPHSSKLSSLGKLFLSSWKSPVP